MKRRILIAAVVLLAITLTACGESRPYTWAIIMLDGETIAEGHVDDWHFYGGGDVRVEIDGKRYRTNLENVILTEEPPANDNTEEVHPC